MLLAVDVGNTQTVLGIYEGSEMRAMWRITTNKLHTADELRVHVQPLLASEGIVPGEFKGAALASVVPALTLAWRDALRRMLSVEPFVLDAESAGEIFLSKYPNPHEIGADRVADAVAARLLYGAPCVVVDFGTATNIEVIDAEGSFLGGIIAPGVDTSANALFAKATKLAAIVLTEPKSAIGSSTEEAIRSGIVYGEADKVDGLVRRVFAELGYEAPVVATGGLASRVAPLSQVITDVNPELTLEGLRLIYEARSGC